MAENLPAVGAEDQTSGDQTAPTAGEPGKTFTQQELDRIIQERVGRAVKDEQRKLPPPEKMAAFEKWMAESQTAEERMAALTQERERLAGEKEALQRALFLVGRGASMEDVEYHAYKIGRMVTDRVTFEAATEQYIRDNARFFGGTAAGPGETHEDAGGIIKLGGGVSLAAPQVHAPAPTTLKDRVNGAIRKPKGG